ncbi:hypothetical protein [Mycobacterium marinum]|uniref:hypothetical protein n=1 Tax=Mycobacterium marinum TaxID=1781 RepID=UPI001924742A|nr:hypothetical protein [Mycobacterium marinum]QQW36884.1 hypothetical protein HXW97_25955 [Mycobacterium marinum]
MNRQERERLIASLTDDELAQLREHANESAPSEDPARQFLRAVMAERDRDWMAEVAERLAAPSQPKSVAGNHVSREGGTLGAPPVSDRDRLVDFARTIIDPTHEPMP